MRQKPPGGKWTASGPHVRVKLALTYRTRTGSLDGEIVGEFIGQRYLDAFLKAVNDPNNGAALRVKVVERREI